MGRYFPTRQYTPKRDTVGSEILASSSLTVVTSANAKARSQPISLSDGFIVNAQPIIVSGTPPPGGGIYVQVIVLQGSVDAVNQVAAIIWQGYVRQGATATSIPNVRVTSRQNLVLYAWAGTDSGMVTVQCNITIAQGSVPGGGYIHDELPGSGPGVQRIFKGADPGVGSEIPPLVVPLGVIWKLKGITASLVTSGVAGNRMWSVAYDNPANTIAAMVFGPDYSQTATTTVLYAGTAEGAVHRTGGTTRPAAPFKMPDMTLSEGMIVTYTTLGIDAGDDWTAASYYVEEWAVPS